MNIALMAHDSKKELLTQFCIAYCGILSRHNLCATGTTGKLIAEATGLNIVRFLSGSQGGDQQIGARIACNEIDLLSGTEEKERQAFEIKSGATFSKEYFKGLNYWSGLSGADSTHKTVIYGGDRSMSTSDGKVSAWKDL